MNLLSVILNDASSYIFEKLDKEIEFLKAEEIIIEKQVVDSGRNIYIEYNLVEATLSSYHIDDFKIMFYYYIANAFSDIIINDMEEKLIYKILTNNYYYFSQIERQSIFKKMENAKEDEEYTYIEGVNLKISRKARILHELIEYFNEDHTINLEGFIRFRLQSYIQELEEHIDKAVEDFLMEKEYNEFIRLLRYFVDIQEAKIDTVHVLIGEGGKYHLYDHMNRNINNEYLDDLATEMADKDISYDDLLISSMITLAPKKIVMHFSAKVKNNEIIKTIKNVFSDRVYVCGGCELCLSAHTVKHE